MDKIQKNESADLTNNQAATKTTAQRNTTQKQFTGKYAPIQTREGRLGPPRAPQSGKVYTSAQSRKAAVGKTKDEAQKTASSITQQTSAHATHKKPPTDDKKVTLSHGFMMLTSEGSFGDDINTVKAPHWPGANSGVTIGFGFDIGAAFPKGTAGEDSARECMIEAGINSSTAGTLAKYTGIRGAEAAPKAHYLKEKGIRITNAQALKLLDTSYDMFNKFVHKYASVESDQVHPALEEVFTYFAYAWWNFSRTKAIYAKVKGKPALEQFTIALQIMETEHKLNPGNKLIHLVRNYMMGIKGYLAQGKEVEISKKVMSLQELLASDTFSMMDTTTKGVGKYGPKGTVSRTILTGQPHSPMPKPGKHNEHSKTTSSFKLTHAPLKEANQGFSVGLPNGVYTSDLINCVKDVRKVQQKLLEVGLLSQADYAQEYPKEVKKPTVKPDYTAIRQLSIQHIPDTSNQSTNLLAQMTEEKEQHKQLLLNQTRERLLNWLHELSDKEVRAIAENPALNTPFAQLVFQSGIGGITNRNEMVAQLFNLRGQTTASIPGKDMEPTKAPPPAELPYSYYMSDLEQRAAKLYGKVPIGAKVLVRNIPKTIEAIRVFQLEIVRSPNPDGRADPGGKTLSKLMEATKTSVEEGRTLYQLHLQKLAAEEKRRKEEEIKRKQEEARKKSQAKKKIVKKQPDPRQQVSKIYKDYQQGKLSMDKLAHQLIPYAGNASTTILKIYDEISWGLRDNFAYAMCAHLSDAQLLKFHKGLLTRMRNEFEESMFYKSSMKRQKERMDRLLKVQTTVKKKKKKKVVVKKKSMPYNDKKISSSVGENGINKAKDVKLIQNNLMRIGYLIDEKEIGIVSKVKNDGTILKESIPHTVKAINKFQKEMILQPLTANIAIDGTVGKNGNTEHVLSKVSSVSQNSRDVKPIAPVMKPDNFISQHAYIVKGTKGRALKESEKTRPGKPNGVCCYDAARAMVKQKGGKLDSNPKTFSQARIQMMQQIGGKNNYRSQNLELGVKFIDDQLKKGNPIFVGVDDERVAAYNRDKSTEHFVVIMEKVVKDEKVYYRYYDPAFPSSLGYSSNNLLLLNNKSITGKRQWSPVYDKKSKKWRKPDFTVTHARIAGFED